MEKEETAWKAFKSFSSNFLGNERAENDRKLSEGPPEGRQTSWLSHVAEDHLLRLAS